MVKMGFKTPKKALSTEGFARWAQNERLRSKKAPIYAKFRSGEAPTSSPTENAPRIPATNPLLEPNRPDLIGEPRIDDERQ